MRQATITRVALVAAQKPSKVSNVFQLENKWKRVERMGDSLVCKVWFAMFATFAMGTIVSLLMFGWQ